VIFCIKSAKDSHFARLAGSIPNFIFITDGKCHDSNTLNVITPISDAIYLMDRAYVDFAALHAMQKAGSLKSTLSIYEIMQILGVSTFDKSPVSELLTESQFNQDIKEQLDLFSINF
jgi:hypothetical protein